VRRCRRLLSDDCGVHRTCSKICCGNTTAPPDLSIVPSDARWASEKENKRGLNCEPRLELLTRASLTRVWNYTFTLDTKTFTLTQHIHYISIHPNIRLSPLFPNPEVGHPNAMRWFKEAECEEK